MSKRYMPMTEGAFVTSPYGPRGGTFHRGTDFGRVGGSGNNPIFAVADGVVSHAGPAQGFGGPYPAGWIVLDHDGSSMSSVYGHIIVEVQVGKKVSAGQRIGRINPNSNTNGQVAPHLHFELHPNRWRAGSQIEPTEWLQGASWPVEQRSVPSVTTFGVDISEHQGDYDFALAKSQGISFVILRLCDGTYKDRWFQKNLKKVTDLGLLTSTYWYLRAPSEGSTISQQVDVIDQQFGGRKDISVWIDVESVDGYGRKLLTSADVRNARDELLRRGYKVPGVYSGAWYWENMPGGEPSMDGLGYLWVSHYGRFDSQGPYLDVYPGNDSARWDYPLGNRKPDILQYGSRGVVANQSVDVNAYRGSLKELKKLFGYQTNESLMERLNMADKITSLVNDSKSFKPETILALIDQGQWENRVLLNALLDKVGLDPKQILKEAYNKDNQNNPNWKPL